MKLRLWVKCLLGIILVFGIIAIINWNKQEYDKCMNYTNGNKIICDKLK